MTNRLQKIEKAIKNMSDDKFNELLNELGVKEDKQWVPKFSERYCEAEAQRDFNTEKAKLIKEIEDSSDKIDWEDDKQSKYYLYYSYDSKKLNVETDFGGLYKIQGTTYTTNRVFLENLIKNEPERVKKYLFGIGKGLLKEEKE